MQFSLFGAAAAEPSLGDLEGVLLAGGHWVRSADGARLSVIVADRWRADALAEAFVTLRVDGQDVVVRAEGGFAVRTAFHPDLIDLAARWTRGAVEVPPPDFVLSPGGLRLWASAAGARDEVGYLFATVAADDALHLAGGAQLSRMGLAAVSVGLRGGPGWRVTSAKRIRRLSELLGEPPPGGESAWPTVR
ncbi:MAG: hypothetical protein M3N95_04355 [Actinomycetota bacterium]|nr:hypothetical protein [Actinomycetota bacterium]